MTEDLQIKEFPEEPPRVHFGKWIENVPEAKTDRLEKKTFRKEWFLFFLLLGLALAVLLAAAHFAVAALILALGVKSYDRIKRGKAPVYLTRLLDLPADISSFPVTAQVRYHGILCWEDDGIATFQSGYLHFEGIHTTFGLRSQDLRGGSKLPRQYASITPRERKGLSPNPFSPGSNKVRVEGAVDERENLEIILEPYGSLPGLGVGLEREFRKQFSFWQRASSDDIAYSTYPDISRSSRVLASLYRHQAMFFGISLVALKALIFSVMFPSLQSTVSLVIGFMVAIATYSVVATLSVNRFNRDTQQLKKMKETFTQKRLPGA